jgi:hypothetical protein
MESGKWEMPAGGTPHGKWAPLDGDHWKWQTHKMRPGN